MGTLRPAVLPVAVPRVSPVVTGAVPAFPFCRYTSPDFLYIRSWLPCIFFSGGVTVGNIGRQLAMVRDPSHA